MPGYIRPIVEAEEKINRFAADHGQGWDVASAFRENLQQAREFGPAASFPEALTQAVKTTQGEIREAAEMEWRQETRRLDQRFDQGREAMRQHLDAVLQNGHTTWQTPASEQAAVQRIALDASDALRHSMYPVKLAQGAVTREHVTGMRKAIMDWSHEHNHELRMQLNQAPRMRMGM